MDIYKLLLLQITAHLLSDFIFQTKATAEGKNRGGFRSKYLYLHLLITFFLSLILSFQPDFLPAALLITAVHGLIDGSKKYVLNTAVAKYLFFIDQILHLSVIALTVFTFGKYQSGIPLWNPPLSLRTLMIIAAFISVTKPANFFIKELIKVYDIKSFIPSETDELQNAGKLIGTLERFLVLMFIVLGQFEAVGFLLAAKSILRYKDHDTVKSEYVLIGTMISFSISIVLGVIINYMS